MVNKNALNKDDYNIYYIELPQNKKHYIFLHKKLEKFVNAELEKKHPFFGCHCNVTFTPVFYNKKLCIKVLVVDTVVLAMNTKKGKNTVLRNFIKFSSVFLLIICILGYYYFQSKGKNTEIEYVKNEITEVNHPVVEIDSCNSLECLTTELNKIIKDSVMCTSYTIQNQLLESKEIKTSLTIALSGIYPENIIQQLSTIHHNCNVLEKISFSPVKFSNNIPNVCLFFSDIKESSFQFSPTDLSLQQTVIRNLIIDRGGLIEEEDWFIHKFDFIIPIKNWSTFYNQLNTFFNENLIGIEFLVLNLFEDNISVSLKVHNLSDFQFDASLKNIFDTSIKVPIVSKTNKIDNRIKEVKIEKTEVKPIIGSIIRNNGSKIDFTFSNDGKIISSEVSYEE